MGKDGDDSNSKVDPIDLDYYLSSSDGPGAVITPVKLRGASNYDEWAKAMRRSMISKFKFGFVDGTIAEPSNDANKLKLWLAMNSMVVSWITNTVEESLRSTLEDFDIAHELWTHLKKRYCVVSGTRMCQLKQSLSECQQDASESVTEYAARLSKVWKEVVQYSRVPRCSCGGCKCNIAKQVSDICEEDYLHYFLIGLDDPYEAICAQLLAQIPLPTVDEAYQTVINTERLRNKGGKEKEKEKENVMAFKVETKPRAKQGDTNAKFCHHCNREGHDEASCYQIIGFPDWWDEKKKGGRGPGRGGRSFGSRGGRGVRGNGVGSNTSVRANMVQSGSVGSSISKQNSDLLPGLTGVSSDQVQQIIELLNKQSSSKLQGKADVHWIIDTGANNHVTSELLLLRNIKTIANNPILLPDGQIVNANQMGSLTLEGGLFIDNVLYVPQINCNLISVTQLCDESNCYVQFTDKMCVIQDHLTRTVIGVGERQDGLYFFRGVPGVRVMAVDCVVDLWHQRMGHPSEKVLKLLPHVSNSTRKNNSICDVCPRAKQCRESFPISSSKASHICLNLFMLIYRVLIRHHFLVALNIFLLLWTIFLELYGCI